MVHLLLAVIYVAFISLGLPDALLGSAWPTIYKDFSVPLSWSGGVFMIIAAGTIVSSLQSDRLTKRFGTGAVTAASVLTTAVALMGFSLSRSYPALCLWAVPYGLGAGSVDASLNNYVALHYKSRHMSWLHCMWGIGAAIGPYIMGAALTGGRTWGMGYRYVSFIQFALTAALMCSLPLWKKNAGGSGGADAGDGERAEAEKALSLKEVVGLPGAPEIMVTFFCYCAVEQTASLWASSYLVMHHGLTAEAAAGFAGMFFAGITAGRFASGFLTMKLSDTKMIYLGMGVILAGVVALFLPLGETAALAGLALLGLGCAPVYPSIIHSTPATFGKDKSQAVIGVQMASAYIGTCLMPPVFGVVANHASVSLFPAYLLVILVCMFVMYSRMLRTVHARR